MGTMIAVRGTRVHVDDLGPRESPALLYLHGGPGTGAYDFVLHQGDRLAGPLRLIAVDQRGVLRSDPVSDADRFGLDDLIEDCEAIRLHLGVKRWSVLGHSFGGYLALLYAVRYPRSVDKLLFENPSFDFASSARSLLRAASLEFHEEGNLEKAAECMATAQLEAPAEEIWRRCLDLLSELGERRDNLYTHGEDKGFSVRIAQESGLPSDLWGRGGTHYQRLLEEGQIFQSLLPLLAQVRHQSLLIRGKYDHVPGDDQVEAYKKGIARGQVLIFEQSGHFARFEEPDRYAEAVTRFVLGRRRTGKK